MGTYSDHEQRVLDQQSGADLDRQTQHQEAVSPKQRTLQQQVMSFLAEGVNTGHWDDRAAYGLVRQMIEANWQSEVATPKTRVKDIVLYVCNDCGARRAHEKETSRG